MSGRISPRVSPNLSSHLFLLSTLILPISIHVAFASLAVSISVFHIALLLTVSISCCGFSILLHVVVSPTLSWAQAIRLRVHPLYLMIPGTVGCSYAFMLPVSTPPNSIAFASGHLLVKDMVSLGIF